MVLFGASSIGPSVLKVTQKFTVGQCSQQMGSKRRHKCRPFATNGNRRYDPVTDLDQLPVSVRQIRLSGQDDTDFEKCLRLINAR